MPSTATLCIVAQRQAAAHSQQFQHSLPCWTSAQTIRPRGSNSGTALASAHLGGMTDNSPMLQHWAGVPKDQPSPEGTAAFEPGAFVRRQPQPSLRDLNPSDWRPPNTEVLGYSQASLRDLWNAEPPTFKRGHPRGVGARRSGRDAEAVEEQAQSRRPYPDATPASSRAFLTVGLGSTGLPSPRAG